MLAVYSYFFFQLPLVQFLRPPPIFVMMGVWNFVAKLPGGRMSIKEMKRLVGNSYGEGKTLRMRAIYKILK